MGWENEGMRGNKWGSLIDSGSPKATGRNSPTAMRVDGVFERQK